MRPGRMWAFFGSWPHDCHGLLTEPRLDIFETTALNFYLFQVFKVIGVAVHGSEKG
jgi:hypothetical protein